MRKAMLVTILSAAIAIASAEAAAPPAANSTQGVYSEAQAAEGEPLYQGLCASCHGADLAGTFETPPLTGSFVAYWSNASVGSLFDYVGSAMPLFAPGTLSREDNARIIAYMLKANGMPAGSAPLPTDGEALKGIAFKPMLPAGLARAAPAKAGH